MASKCKLCDKVLRKKNKNNVCSNCGGRRLSELLSSGLVEIKKHTSIE